MHPIPSRCTVVQVIAKLTGKKREGSIIEKEPILKEWHDKGSLTGSIAVAPPGSKATKVRKGPLPPVRFSSGAPVPEGGASGRQSTGSTSSGTASSGLGTTSSGGMIRFDPSSHVSKTIQGRRKRTSTGSVRANEPQVRKRGSDQISSSRDTSLGSGSLRALSGLPDRPRTEEAEVIDEDTDDPVYLPSSAMTVHRKSVSPKVKGKSKGGATPPEGEVSEPTEDSTAEVVLSEMRNTMPVLDSKSRAKIAAAGKVLVKEAESDLKAKQGITLSAVEAAAGQGVTPDVMDILKDVLVGRERKEFYWEHTARSVTQYSKVAGVRDPFLTDMGGDFARIVFFLGYLLMCCSTINPYTVRTKYRARLSYWRVDCAWLVGTQMTEAIRSAFPARSVQKVRADQSKNLQAPMTVPMIMWISQKLLLPTKEQLAAGWKPNQLFATIATVLFMCMVGCRPSQVTWNYPRPPFSNHNMLVPEVTLVFVLPDGREGALTANSQEVDWVSWADSGRLTKVMGKFLTTKTTGEGKTDTRAIPFTIEVGEEESPEEASLQWLVVQAMYHIARYGGHTDPDDYFFSFVTDSETGKRKCVLPAWGRKLVKEAAQANGYDPQYFGLRSARIAMAIACQKLGKAYLRSTQ